MRVALIPPRNMLSWARKGSMHFIVPQNAVTKFFRGEIMYKMLDNGTYETGEPMDLADLFIMSHDLVVDEIVLPDVMRDKTKTISLVAHAVTVRRPKHVKYVAVPQGKNLLEFIECYRWFAQFPELDVLCFPISLEKDWQARPQVVNYLIKKGYWANNKEHHLIGLDRLSELYCYRPGLIRSVDTSLPFSAAYHGQVISDFSHYTGPRVNLEGATFNTSGVNCLRFNIKKLLEAASYS